MKRRKIMSFEPFRISLHSVVPRAAAGGCEPAVLKADHHEQGQQNLYCRAADAKAARGLNDRAMPKIHSHRRKTLRRKA
jgi:hypothetical protein